MQKTVFADAEIHERRLYAGFNIYNFSLINTADMSAKAGPLDVQFFEHPFLNYRNPALLAKEVTGPCDGSMKPPW